MTPRLLDISHTVEHGLITYKGFPAPLVCDFLSREASRAKYAPGTEFQIDRIEMVGNTGTYVDSPFHRYADGKDLAALPLESLANLECLVVRHDDGMTFCGIASQLQSMPFFAFSVGSSATRAPYSAL